MPAIESKPEVLGGTPCFTGTRVPVTSLLDALRHGRTLDDFLLHFPTVERDQVQAVLDMIKRGMIRMRR